MVQWDWTGHTYLIAQQDALLGLQTPRTVMHQLPRRFENAPKAGWFEASHFDEPGIINQGKDGECI